MPSPAQHTQQPSTPAYRAMRQAGTGAGTAGRRPRAERENAEGEPRPASDAAREAAIERRSVGGGEGG
jgi:hypothetical protein